jgi:uncharacterized delta-60 repeat protein
MKKPLRNILAGVMCSAPILGAGSAFGKAGDLDTTFGNGGVSVISFASGGFVIPDAIQLQSDGKILVLLQDGNVGHGVLRFTTSGVPDTTFGSNGAAGLSPSFGASLALQPNGQIVIAGLVTSGNGSALGVERLNTNGSLDTAFGSNGLATASLGGRGTGVGEVVLVQPNGFILVCAQLEPTGRRQPFQTILARFNSVGVLDPSFGTQGTAVATGSGGCTALAQLSNGDYLVVDAQAFAEFTASGSVASTITTGTLAASNGSQEPSTPSVFQPNGDYLFGTELFVGEESRGHNSSAEVLRFTEIGAADTSFANPAFHYIGTGGSGIEAVVNGLAVQSNGDIVVVGNQTTFAQSGTTIINGLARLTPNGNLDPAFGNGGTIVNSVPAGTDELFGVVIQANGNIITVGTASVNGGFDNELTLARYLGN